jgi:hypothetical protein
VYDLWETGGHFFVPKNYFLGLGGCLASLALMLVQMGQYEGAGCEELDVWSEEF